jgi:myo-inositol-1(or 4)-monophosphatase
MEVCTLQVIKAIVMEQFPEHSILGEESVPSGSAASAAALESFLSKEWLWIVDPIDGTTNFVHGMPASVVSIGVAHNGKVS